METTNQVPPKKESRCEIRKKAKRFEQSRDNLKAKNREKAANVKKLSDRLSELELSRDHWRKKNSEAEKKCRLQEDELERAVNKANTFQAECDQLRQQIEILKKKKSRLFW